jgi:hypothetical protein
VQKIDKFFVKMEKKEPAPVSSPQVQGTVVPLKTNKFETASAKITATYIERPWHDIATLIDCLNMNKFSQRQKQPLRLRARRVINIGIEGSELAYFNFTFTRSNPNQRVINPRRPCEKVPDAFQQVGLDYDLESDEELAEMQGEDVENDEQGRSDGTVEEAQDEEGNDMSLIEEGFIIKDEDAFSEDEEGVDQEKQQRNQRMKILE